MPTVAALGSHPPTDKDEQNDEKEASDCYNYTDELLEGYAITTC
jgi:hypothetical protein